LRYRPGRVHVLSLVALAVVGLALLAIAERSMSPIVQPHFAEKMEAATKARHAIDVIRSTRLGMGGEIDIVNDPNETGVIGHEFTLITTDRGWRGAKQRALDPNLAAVFVELLKRARVGEGDRVAVGVTGAFPLLNASAIIATEVVGAEPVVITSVGSSMWGATDPELTWLDMETALTEAAVVSHRSIAASIGGGGDVGRGLSPEGRDLIVAAIERNGVELVRESTLDGSIEARMAVFRRESGGERYDAYINVGGGLASVGSGQVAKLVRPGLTKALSMRDLPRRGVLVRMADEGVPVIHVPDADRLIERYGLMPPSEEPGPLPEVGVGEVFAQERYNAPLAATLAVLYGFLIFVVVRIDIKHYVFRRRGVET